jgi:excisionase family DNA binding protein
MPVTTNARTRVRGTRTIQESARLFGCGYAAVVTMLEKGELPFIEAGNRRLLTIAGLEAKLGKPIEELEARAVAVTEEV